MIQTVKAKVKLKRLDKNGKPVYKEIDKYRFRVYYTNSLGEQKRKESKLYLTKREAVEAEALFVSLHKNQSDSSGIYFRDLYEMYKIDLLNNVEESTFVTKMNKIDKHVYPYFEKYLIDKITPLTIREWQHHMLSKKYTREGKQSTYAKSDRKSVV